MSKLKTESTSKRVKTVEKVLVSHGIDFRLIELEDSASTARAAADALNCQISQIVKSLIFRTEKTNKAILVLASGINRVNEQFIENAVSEHVLKADANFVREVTGFAIGGVAPLGHKQVIETYIDEDLLAFDTLWAAAGTPHAVFSIRPIDLLKCTQGKVISIVAAMDRS